MATKAKVGDIVHVRCKVVRLGEPGLELTAVMTEIWARNDDIIHVEPQSLKVGDLVRSTHGARGELLAIDGDFAWVRFPGGPSTIKIAALERA